MKVTELFEAIDKYDVPEMSVLARMKHILKTKHGYSDADFEDQTFADIESMFLDDAGEEDFRKQAEKSNWTGRKHDAVIVGTHKRGDDTWYDVAEFGRFNETIVHVPAQNMHGTKTVGTGGRLKYSRPKGWMFYDRRLVYGDPSMSLTVPGADVKVRIQRAKDALKND